MATGSVADPPSTGPNMSTVGHAAAADDGTATVRVCRICGLTKPLAEFPRTKDSITGQPLFLRRCRPCHRVRKAERDRQRREAGDVPSSSTERERRARIRRAFGHDFVEGAPDPAPARLLVDLLREDRDRWRFDFDGAWREDVDFVLAQVDRDAERTAWREVFQSTRAAWEAAWSGEPAPGPGWSLSPALAADDPSIVPSSDRAPLLLA
jgi:hypothetical protein